MFEALERFTLLDVEGIFLDNPGDELEIVEPIGFSDMIMNLQRDSEYRGINAEFGDGDTELGFDWNKETGANSSAYQMLKAIVEAKGHDMNVFVRYYRTPYGGTESLEFEWIVIGKSLEQIDSQTRFRIKKENFGDKLRTRLDTEVDVFGTKDLDGNTVSALASVTLPLHSRAVLLQVDADIVDGNINSSNAVAFEPVYTQLPFNLVTLAEFPYLTSAGGFSTTEPTQDNYVFGPFSEKGTLSIGISNLDITVTINLDASSGSAIHGFDLYIKSKLFDSFGNVISSDTLYTLNQTYSPAESPLVTEVLSNISGSIEYTIERDYIVLLYAEFMTDTEAIGTIFVDLARLTPTDGNLLAEFTSYANPSTVQGNFIFDVLDDSLKKAIGQSLNSTVILSVGGVSPYPFIVGETVNMTTGSGVGVLESIDGSNYTVTVITPFDSTGIIYGQTSTTFGIVNFINLPNVLDSSLIAKTENGAASDGLASLNFITTGKLIRGIGSRLSFSPSKIVDFLRCRYNAGFNVANSLVEVELAANFFHDIEILTLTNVENPTKRRLNNELLYNEVEASYFKYAKENENNSINGFNTKRSWLTPIEKDKNKLSLAAPVVTDGAEIERVRRLKIKQDQSDQSDEEIFVIKCQRFNSANPFVNGNYDTSKVYVTIDDTNNSIILNGLYLNGQLTGVTEISLYVFFIGPYTQTISIDSVAYDAENNQTTISTTDSITAPDGDYILFSFYFDVDVFLPERIEAFESSFISGVVDKYSEYNIDHAPTNFLLYWYNFIGANLIVKDQRDTVKFTQGTNNVSLSKRYKSGQGITTSQIVENQDFSLSSLKNINEEIFKQWEWEVVSYMDHDDFILLRNSLLGQSTTSPPTNYGYVEFTDEFGTLVQIFPNLVRRNNVTNRTEIVGWEKQVPTPSGTYYMLLEAGDKIKLEDETGFFELEH